MHINIGRPVGTVVRQLFGGSEAEHLRIKDVIEGMQEAESRILRARAEAARQAQLRQAYDNSVRNIDDNIYALASAATSLDRVEGKLMQARGEIVRLASRGEPIDFAKVERTLMALAEHINLSVRTADEQCVNLLRDTRLQVRIAECASMQHGCPGEGGAHSMQVDLTLIAIDKLIAHKLRDEPQSADEMIGLLDAVRRVVYQNVHILSSLILTLFAARDYTKEVVDLVLTGPMPSAGAEPAIAAPSHLPALPHVEPAGSDEEAPIQLAAFAQPMPQAPAAPLRHSAWTSEWQTQIPS